MLKTGREWAHEYRDSIKLLNRAGWIDDPADFDSVPLTREEFIDKALEGRIEFLDIPSKVLERLYDDTKTKTE